VFTIFWLTSGIFIRATIPFISFSLAEILDITRCFLSSKKIKMEKQAEEEREWAMWWQDWQNIEWQRKERQW
jgi:hypothetical protein